MIETIRKLFGLGPSADYRALLERGAVIVDVRTAGEFKQGHIRTSVNIPLDELPPPEQVEKRAAGNYLLCIRDQERTSKRNVKSKGI